MRRRPLLTFFVLAYALSWAWWVPLVLAGELVRPGTGWPTHFPGLLGPALAAFVVTARTHGRAGVRDLVGRMGHWRVAPRWYGWVLAPLALFAVAATGVGLSGGGWPAVADFGVISGLSTVGVLGVCVLIFAVNAYGEETGWRGYALPALQRRHDPLTASLLLAVGWAGWHAPLFFLLASYRDFGAAVLPGFFIGMVAGAIVLTWLTNGAGGSVLLPALWHTSYNLVAGTAAAQGAVAAVVTTGVIGWALALAVQARRCPRRIVPVGAPR
jgi:membrane protease YdiL (CAAX protease family)